MSVPFAPGLEQGTSLEGNIEISENDIQTINIPNDKAFEASEVQRSEILTFGDEGFLLHRLFTSRECLHYIEEGEKLGFETIRGVRDDYRSCKRITIRSPELSALLWHRIEPFLGDITINGDPHDSHIHGTKFLLQGTWKPVGVNDIFRLCRYLPGGHFAPHFDGHYDKTPDVRSLKTLMIYLNGDFEGGSTNFVDDCQTLYKDEAGKYCAEEKNVLCSIQPEPGMAILFNHFRLHEGAQLRTGKKYILRTDVMYRNSGQTCTDDQKLAVSLLQQAETLENAGRCMEAAELYRKAFKFSPELEASH